MDEELPKHLRRFIHEHLTEDEKTQIVNQIYGHSLRNRQVLWTGMAREDAQSWADNHGLQTLTTAMGPLMDPKDPRCPHQEKGKNGWTRYVLGASAIFAWYISKGDLVTVLTHPPPELFHPSGKTSYQVIEEPILKGLLGNRPVGRIELVHPAVPNATVLRYQIWPKDESYRWNPESNAHIPCAKWRQVKLCGPPRGFEVVCGLGGMHKAPGKRVNKLNPPEHHPELGNTILSGSESHQLKSLQGEQSKALKKLQQKQCETWKQLLNQQSKEEELMQKRHSKQFSAVSLKRKKEKKREGLRQAFETEMRHLHEKHERVKVELRTKNENAIRTLKKKQARERRKASKANPETTSNLVRQHLGTDEIPTTAELKEKQTVTGIFEEEQQERTPNFGQDRWEVATLGQAFFFSLVMAGLKYIVDSLAYLTQ